MSLMAQDHLQYKQLMDEYIRQLAKANPVQATRQGIHDYDDSLGEYTPDTMQQQAASYRALRSQFAQLDQSQLNDEDALDYPFVMATLALAVDFPDSGGNERGSADPERAPQFFPQLISDAIFPLMAGDFAPVEERMASIAARLRGVGKLLQGAQQTLNADSPPIWVDMAMQATQGAARFLDTAVVGFAETVPERTAEIKCLVTSAQQALADYQRFLGDLASRANGNYRSGVDKYDYLIKNYHMLDLDHKSVHEFGLEEVATYSRDMARLAKKMGFGDDWIAALESVKDEHPAAEDLVKVYDEEVELARQYIMAQDLVTVPPEGECPCDWMPVFMRPFNPIALPWISPMFDPGYKGVWHITPVDTDAPALVQQQHLQDNSYAWIRSIAHHEIFPGHYMQRLVVKLVGTDFRKLSGSTVYSEGWTMYWEQYLREIGFLGDAPLHMMQLRNALWRAVRIVVDTGLHTREMSQQEAVDYLVNTARLEPRWAQSQMADYTTHPTGPSCYLLGKREVIQLKKDYMRHRGAQATEKDFHDTYLRYGTLPVALVRRAMLGA